jgi:uncharacterized protein (DUF2225 family)
MRLAQRSSIWLICLSMLLAVAQPGSTNTEPETDITCPMCHTTFKAVIDLSSSRQGMRLDLKPVGSIPAPWAIPKCPKCGFIVYKQEWEEEEQLQVQQFVNSDEYKTLLTDNSTYYILAKIYEHVGMDDLEIAHTYLKASWQVEHDKVKCAKYMTESLKHFEAFLASKNEENRSNVLMADLVSGEIERRLSMFDQAAARFTRLKLVPEYKEVENITTIINYQLVLIAAKDTAPHEIDR